MYSRYVSYSPPCIAIRIVFVTWCIRSSPSYITPIVASADPALSTSTDGNSMAITDISLSAVREIFFKVANALLRCNDICQNDCVCKM